MTEKKKSNLTLLAIICCIVCLTLGIAYGLQKQDTGVVHNVYQFQKPKEAPEAAAVNYNTGVDVSSSPNFSATPYEPPTQDLGVTTSTLGGVGLSKAGGPYPPPSSKIHATPLPEHYPRKLDSNGGYAKAASF